jgi:hypothetical protein
METKSKIIVALIIAYTITVFILGRYTAPEIECPDIKKDTITIVEYREPDTRIDTVYVTAEVIDTTDTGDEGEVFVPEILRVDTTFADSSRLELIINEATNIVAIEHHEAPVKIREITTNTIVTEIKEVPTPISRKEKVQLVAIVCAIGIVVSAFLVLSSGA